MCRTKPRPATTAVINLTNLHDKLNSKELGIDPVTFRERKIKSALNTERKNQASVGPKSDLREKISLLSHRTDSKRMMINFLELV